jgi:hypothetical protein
VRSIERPAPSFFVPGIPPDCQEDIYAAMAKACGLPLPPLTWRVFSIVYVHDGVEWTATVGERLSGTKTTTKRGRQYTSAHSDNATVLAIFPGAPYVVLTNKGPYFGNGRSQWENPFSVARPMQITLFHQSATF